MRITISPNAHETGVRAAREGAACLRKAIEANGEAGIILATGASQLEMLSTLVREPLDWARVTAFHLDEYLGLPSSHPASFRRYLSERFLNLLPAPAKAFHFVNGEADPAEECDRLGHLINPFTIDVAFIGIGENGHLAFNDPPADFETEEPFLVVDLDEACRRQQLGEGWFPTLEDIPRRAISMSIRQILKSTVIICTVPDERKAAAVRAAVQGPVTPETPASILQTHPDCRLYLDRNSASRLQRRCTDG
jgi:glucosamine-6-phosphate deaminase